MSDTNPRSPIHLCVVEDDPDDMALTLRVLAACCPDRVVTMFQDGKDVIDHLVKFREGGSETLPDLVLLDLKLPRVSGIEVLQWLRANPATRGVAVAVLTSARDDRQILALHRLGIVAYLEKPLKPKDLSKTLSGIQKGTAQSRV